MAETILFAYKQQFGVLPSRPSQLIAFSKLQHNLPTVNYTKAKTLLEIAKNKQLYRPRPPPPSRNLKQPRPPPSITNLIKEPILYIKTDYSDMSQIYNKNNKKHKYKQREYNNNDMMAMNGNNNNNKKNNNKSQQDEEAKMARIRRKAVDELVHTEKTYLLRLEKLMKYFVNPLKKFDDKKIRKLLTQKDHSIIFPSDLATIYALHIQLQSDLIKAAANWNNETSKIGHIFIEYGELFKLYQDYMYKHEKGIQHLMKLERENKSFAQWNLQQSNKVNGLTVQALLILPIQRLPRYELLLKEIIKRTKKYHTDLYDLQNALDQICEVTELINDRMKEHDRRIKVAMVEKRFIDLVDSIGHFVKPSRIFIAESSSIPTDENYIIRHDKFGNKIPIVVFLFNDCLIYGYYENNKAPEISKSNSSSMTPGGFGSGSMDDGYFTKKKNKLRFGSILVFDALFNIEDVEFDDDYNYKKLSCLKLYARHHSIWISFQSYQAKLKWFEMISHENDKINASDLNHRRSLTKKKKKKNKNNANDIYLPIPVFVPDDYSDICMECKAKFSVLNRRHHCYFCGKLCCKKCTKYKLIDIWRLHFEQKKEYVRVCQMCKLEREDYLNKKQNKFTYYTTDDSFNHINNNIKPIFPQKSISDLDDIKTPNDNNDNDDNLSPKNNKLLSVSPMSHGSGSPTTFDLTMHHSRTSSRSKHRRNKIGQHIRQKSHESNDNP